MGVKLGRSNRGRFHRLSVFENRVLREIFRTKRDEETRKWRRLQ